MKIVAYIALGFSILAIGVGLYRMIETQPNFDSFCNVDELLDTNDDLSVMLCDEYNSTVNMQTYATLGLGIVGAILGFLAFFKLMGAGGAPKILGVVGGSLSIIAIILAVAA